jgi:hypothetical protein
LAYQSAYIYDVLSDPLWQQYLADQGVNIVPVFKKRGEMAPVSGVQRMSSFCI